MSLAYPSELDSRWIEMNNNLCQYFEEFIACFTREILLLIPQCFLFKFFNSSTFSVKMF